MALTFPLPLASFWDLLPIWEISLDLGEAMQNDRTAGGEQLSADLGSRLWQGSVTFGNMTYAEIAQAETLLDTLRQAGRSFLLTDIRRELPLADPTGSILGASAPSVYSILSTRELRLAGLPVGYVLTPGDYLGFIYDGVKARRGFHRIVTGGVANGSGQSPALEVVPPLRPGLAISTAVHLIDPVMKAVVVPGSAVRGNSRRGITSGGGFEFAQTLR